MRRLAALLLPLAVLLLLLASADGTGQAAPDTNLFSYSDNGYVILDPAHASLYRLNDERILIAIQECLTLLDPVTGKARPGAAERWEASADRKTWTFHLRKDAVWTDGSPVRAKDFVRSWKRTMDPFTQSQWTALFRPLAGCATISDNSARTEGYGALRNGLRDLKAANPNGIPGADLNLLLDETGVRPFLQSIKSRSVQRMLKWDEEKLFPPEMVNKAIDALKDERKEVKGLWTDALEAFGSPGSGAHAKDDFTLVLQTVGDVPYLPELLARGAFAPLHENVEALRDKAFEPENYVTSGPFLLKGRGAHPPENQPEKQVLSVVHLAKNPQYRGPSPAQVEEIKCYTDQGRTEDILQYERQELQWVNTTWREFPQKKAREAIEALKGFAVRPTPYVLYLRFRCDREPFKNKAARKAFALTMDRAALAGVYWPKAQPADRLVPDGIEGRVAGIRCPQANTAEAKAAVKEAAMDSDTWIELSYGESPGQDEVATQLIHGWKKELGIEPGKRIESEQDVRNVLRSGKYYAMLSVVRGSVNDPSAYLQPLHSDDADSGLGWRDAAFDALLDAARDADVALADPEAWLTKVDQPGLKGALEGAKAGADGRARFRLEALAAAERRLLDEYVVVPVLFLQEATLLSGVSGLGEDAARNNPGFVGSLRSATR